MKITLISPFPPGRGSGGWGQKSKLKAGAAGNKEGTPPAGYRDGNFSQCHAGARPPPGAWFALISQCRAGSGAGMQGAPPLASPALDRLRHLQNLPSRYPAQREVHGLPPEWQEMLSFGQCRQPRRGGTGGEELRRLRWSSPPGQGEQVPPGFSPLRVRLRQGGQARIKARPTANNIKMGLDFPEELWYTIII